MEIVGFGNKFGEALTVFETKVVNVGEGVFLRSGEINQILKIDFYGFGLLNFLQAGEMNVFNSGGEVKRIGSDGGGEDDFGVGKVFLDGRGDVA